MKKALFTDGTSMQMKDIQEGGKSGVIEGSAYNWDIKSIGENRWTVINESAESFIVVLKAYSSEEKKLKLKIDGERIEVTEKTEFDILLEKLGISGGASKKLKEIKAPMPGLVIEVKVTEGQEVKEGDVIVILEAMKMENVIKATAEAKVKSVNVNAGDSIEKGVVMVNFE